MNATEAAQRLEQAVQSRASAGLIAALPLMAAVGCDDARHRMLVLHFLTEFAHTADLTSLDTETLAAALRQSSHAVPPDAAWQRQLFDIHRTLLERALEGGLKEMAVAVASSATECGALSHADRGTLLILLLRGPLRHPSLGLSTTAVADELSQAADAASSFGAAALFAVGNWLAQVGDLKHAIDFCRRSVEQVLTPRYCYNLIHLQQLAGWWEAAGEVIGIAPASSSAVACLYLQQAYHEEGSAGLPAPQSDPLIGARRALLTGDACDYLPATVIALREVAEETLRINLALAVRAREQGHLRQYMDDPLFLLLPVPETEFYHGVLAWLSGDSVAARSKLGLTVELAPGFLPALRCLAAVKADFGDHHAAGALWDKITQLAPADGNAFVHRAMQFAAAGDIAKGIASLRAYCARSPQDERVHYYLARLHLSTAFGRAGVPGEGWAAIEKTAIRAASILDRLTTVPEAVWFAWVGRVMRTPPAMWPECARVLLAAEPPESGTVPPVEAQWLRGQLRILTGDAEAALEGIRMLADAAGIRPEEDVIVQLSAACWRVTLCITSADQANRFAEYVEPLTLAVPGILEPLDFLAARFSVHPRMVSTVGNEPDRKSAAATMANVRTLMAAGDTVMLEGYFNKLRVSTDARRLLTAGIIALELRAFDNFARMSVSDPPGEQWEILQTVALAKQGHTDAVGAFCSLLDRAAAGKRAWPTGPFLAGLLAFLGAKARKHVRDRLSATLASLPQDVAAGDHDVAICFLRTSVLLGQSDRAVRILEGHPVMMTWEVRRDLERVRYHQTAQAIEAGNFRMAAEMTQKIASEAEDNPPLDIGAVHRRIRNLAATEALLAALSPNPTLRADAARFGHLANLLETLGEAPPRKSANRHGRDVLRNRLGECRRKLSAEQWQAHFRSLAILHWEWGLSAMKLDPPLAEESIECFRFAHFLWRHLLTHARFWTTFAVGGAVAPDELAILPERIEVEILDCHRDQAHLYLTVSDAEGCRFHLSCLHHWDRPAQMQYLTPDSVEPRPAEGFSPEIAASLQRRAAAAFEGWVDGVLWRARKLRDDPAVLEHLPPGISRDYDAAIRIVDEALAVVPDQHRLCMFLLEHNANYTYELYASERYGEARSLVGCAIEVARRVANEKFREKRLTGPNGEVIRRIFDYACKLEPDPSLLIPLLGEYLHWNGPDAEAEQRLHLVAGEAAFEAQDYDTAIEHLEQIHDSYQGELLLAACRTGRADELLTRGDQLLDMGKLGQARALFQQAEHDLAAVVASHPDHGEAQSLLRSARGRL